MLSSVSFFGLNPWLLRRAGSRPGGALLFFASPKKRKQKKGEPDALPFGFAALLGPAGVGLNSPTAQTTPALIRPALRYSPAHDGEKRVTPALRFQRITPQGATLADWQDKVRSVMG